MKRRFLLHLLLFLLPVVLYLLLTIALPYYSGEFTPSEEIARWQTGSEPLLYGRAYRGNTYAYKLAGTRLRQPEVLALGSSRVLQLRAEFFDKNPALFYNAGSTIYSVGELKTFLMQLPQNARPRVLLVGLDQRWFSPLDSFNQNLTPVENLTGQRVLNISRQVLQDYFAAKIPIDVILRATDPIYKGRALGFKAAVFGSGFRNDGSYQYGEYVLYPRSPEERFNNDRIGDLHLIGGDSILPTRLTTLEDLLSYCRDNDIYVIAFSPPFAPSIYQEMRARGTHAYLSQMPPAFEALFDQYGFAYFNYTDPAQFGYSDEDMYDSFHGSERVYFTMYLDMLAHLPDVLGPYSSLSRLRAFAANPPAANPFEIFPFTSSKSQESR